MLHVKNINKTRRALQITVCAIHKLLKDAYETDKLVEDKIIDFDLWCAEKCEEQPTFKYWYMIQKIVLIYLVMMKSIREGDFEAYKCSLSAIIPYFFSNDNTHYSRWGTIHLHDMLSLQEKCPSIYNEFVNGNFVFHESNRIFSGVALDQAHEHNNRYVKSDGGVIGITENESALLRWMTSGPQISQLIKTFEESTSDKAKQTSHHEAIPSEQRKFFRDVKEMTDTIKEYGNPFLEESRELVSLDTNLVSDKEILNKFESRGEEQFKEFRKKVNNQDFYLPIKKNNFEIFQDSLKTKNKNKPQKSLKQDCVLFSNLFIMCQTRQLDLDEFFKHENQACPPALSKDGELYKGTKSDLVTVLKDETKIEPLEVQPDTDFLIIDGAMYVHTHQPTTDTFLDYTKSFVKHIESKIEKHLRVDIIFDQYKKDSLKSETRNARGDGRRCKVVLNGKVPKNWKGFLRNSENKKELFELLGKSIHNVQTGLAYATLESSSICNRIIREPIMSTHEEADTRLFVHLKHAIQNDFISSASIHANDSDIIILAIALYNELSEMGLNQLWVSYGRGRGLVWFPIHRYANYLGISKSKSLLFFHSISGCDTVSAFKSKGKRSFFQTWQVFPEITPTFLSLSTYPADFNKSDEEMIEKFISLLYDRSSQCTNINDTRKKLFSQKNIAFDNLPPTSAALKFHIQRAVYQASIVWGQSLINNPSYHSPDQWGWKKNSDGAFDIFWTNLSPIAKSCAELCKCGCKKECSGRCSCKQSNLPCTSRCSCSCIN